jgi:hypothetical protein
MIIKELKSGTIDIVSNGMMLMLQFNCHCDDALPYCRAMCCKMRMKYNVALDKEEAKRLVHIDMYQDGKLVQILPWKDDDYSCIHLEHDKCLIQDKKPHLCREEHCSPKGNLTDPTIKTRFNGWTLFPSHDRVQ